jgi:uncharacterized membrane protein (UPF0127 family)
MGTFAARRGSVTPVRVPARWTYIRTPPTLLACVVSFLVVAGCTQQFPKTLGPEFRHGTLSVRTTDGSVTLSVRTASTAEAKAQGLMGQTRLAENAGMVFVSDQPTDTPFWMKDTTIPLSVAFWNSRHEIVDMLDMSPCTSDPCPLYRSSSPYIGAVEVNRGLFADRGVRVGDRIQLHLRVSE